MKILAAMLALFATTLAVAQRPVLVELFTSEGCSSCPPADALLRQIEGKTTASGRSVIVLSEHVTYWNHLGYRDPFSLEEVTNRQNAYGDRFHLDSVYTPQMVVNGETLFVGSDRRALGKALDAASGDGPELKIADIEKQGNKLAVRYVVSGAGSTFKGEMAAYVTDDSDTTHVSGGENGGRTLVHTAVARSYRRTAVSKTEGVVTLPLPQGAEIPRHVTLVLQQPRQGKVLAAATQPLAK